MFVVVVCLFVVNNIDTPVALVKMEELLNEMRQDINKLPAQLANQSSVTQKLQLSDSNILTRLTAGVPIIQAGKQSAPIIQVMWVTRTQC